MERRLRVVLRIQRDIEAGLRQREAKQFALAGAVFDQEDGGMCHHYRRGHRRECAGLEYKKREHGMVINNSQLRRECHASDE